MRRVLVCIAGIIIVVLCIIKCTLLLVHKLFVRVGLRLGSNPLGFCSFLFLHGSFELGVVLAISGSGLRCCLFCFQYCSLSFCFVCICLALLVLGSLRIGFSSCLLLVELGSLSFCCSLLLLGFCLVR